MVSGCGCRRFRLDTESNTFIASCNTGRCLLESFGPKSTYDGEMLRPKEASKTTWLARVVFLNRDCVVGKGLETASSAKG